MADLNFSQYLNGLQEKKQQLLTLANKAVEYGWIPRYKKDSNLNQLSSISFEGKQSVNPVS